MDVTRLGHEEYGEARSSHPETGPLPPLRGPHFAHHRISRRGRRSALPRESRPPASIALQRDGRFPSMWIPSGCAVIQELAPFSDPPR